MILFQERGNILGQKSDPQHIICFPPHMRHPYYPILDRHPLPLHRADQIRSHQGLGRQDLLENRHVHHPYALLPFPPVCDLVLLYLLSGCIQNKQLLRCCAHELRAQPYLTQCSCFARLSSGPCFCSQPDMRTKHVRLPAPVRQAWVATCTTSLS